MNYDNHCVTIPVEDYETYKCYQRSIERLSNGIRAIDIGESCFDKNEPKSLLIRVDIPEFKNALGDIYAKKANGRPITIEVINE